MHIKFLDSCDDSINLQNDAEVISHFDYSLKSCIAISNFFESCTINQRASDLNVSAHVVRCVILIDEINKEANIITGYAVSAKNDEVIRCKVNACNELLVNALRYFDSVSGSAIKLDDPHTDHLIRGVRRASRTIKRSELCKYNISDDINENLQKLLVLLKASNDLLLILEYNYLITLSRNFDNNN